MYSRWRAEKLQGSREPLTNSVWSSVYSVCVCKNESVTVNVMCKN